jgi:hypothetical protein
MAECLSTVTAPDSERKKKANRTSHRYNRLPLLPSGPGGIQQELVVPACWRKDTMLRGKKVRQQKKS